MHPPKLPLDSPRWLELATDGTTPARVLALLGAIERDGLLAARDPSPRPRRGASPSATPPSAWNALVGGPILHQGTVYEATYAALPHVVEAAAGLPPAELADFWVDVGFIARSFYARRAEWAGPPPDLAPGLRGALEAAERLALESFLAARHTATTVAYHALACLALTGHRVGRLLGSAPTGDGGLFAVVDCPRCGEADLEFMCVGGGIALYERAMPTRADALQPTPQPPDDAGLANTPARPEHPWAALADALEPAAPTAAARPPSAAIPAAFAERHAGFLGVGATVARAGVPPSAPDRAVLCLLPGMVALKGECEWAAQLARLAGEFRCPLCNERAPFAEAHAALVR